MTQQEDDNPCKPIACELQTCIQRHQFQQEKCSQVIERLYTCCEAFYERNGDDARSASCPDPRALRAKRGAARR